MSSYHDYITLAAPTGSATVQGIYYKFITNLVIGAICAVYVVEIVYIQPTSLLSDM